MSPLVGLMIRGAIRHAASALWGRFYCRAGASAAPRIVVALAALVVLVTPSTSLAGDIILDGGAQGSLIRAASGSQTVSWGSFTPNNWVLSVPFTSTVVAQSPLGLEPLTDAYAVSTDAGVTWSPWSSDGLSADIPISTTHQITVANLMLPDSANRNYIRFRVVETGGAESISQAFQVRVDATAPAAPINLTANPATWTNTGSFTVNWTNPSDAAGIAGAWYKLDAPPASPGDGIFVDTSNSITGITPNSDGAHPIYVWLQDVFGRTDPQNSASATLYWDTTPPEPPTRMTGLPARQWTNVNKFSESWRSPADLSGIVGAYYKLNGLPSSATDGAYVATVNSTISNIQVPSEGRHDIYVWLVDAAGNLDPQALTGDPDVFWYDATLPVSSLIVTPTLPATGWYTSSVAASLSAVDLPIDTAYPPTVYYKLDAGAWTAANTTLTFNGEGQHRLQYQAKDKAGNLEAIKSFDFGIDLTAPTVTLQADRLPNPTNWYTAAVTYTLSVADAVSGSPRGFYRLNDGPWQAGLVDTATTFSLAAEGSYRIQYYGQDAAGNRSPEKTVEAHVDATPPTTTMAIDGTPGENGWYVSNVVVKLQPQDNGSGSVTTWRRINGAAWQTGGQFALSGDGIYNLDYYSVDAAGNTGPVVSTQIKIDSAAPATPTGLSASPSGWSRTNAFTIQWTSPSDLSGVTGAYYKLGDLSGGGAPTTPKDGTAAPQTQRIEGLAVPAEGSYRLYLWLRDAAGNADQKTAPGSTPPASGPILRYDASAPTTTAQAQGQAGQNGWWLSPVSVTLTATDSASGVASLHYRVDGGAWQTTNKATATVAISQPDKHVVEYYAEDVAGNFEAVQQYTVRLDFTAPAAPAVVRVLPTGWTRYSSFHIEWSTVTDLSNIGGAYVKFGAPPVSPTDGVFYAGSTQVDGVKAPGEGQHSVYVWLRDRAGNANHQSAVAIANSVWYDGTPPTSIITPTAASGLNGWYVEPVTFDVSANDTASGLREVRYQIDDGAIQSAHAAALPPQTLSTALRFVVSTDGRHTVRIWAVDQAGNEEPAHVYQIAIDTTPPVASFSGPTTPVTKTQFDVSWVGGDYRDGSGLANYDVQVRDGLTGAWQDWLVQTQVTSAQFEAQRSHRYFFRVYGRDRAGNRQASPGVLSVLVQPVLNGSFDTGNFTDWTVGGLLYSSVVATTGPANVSILAAKLGSEVYGPSLTPPGNVPPGCATLNQALTIPTLQQLKEPRLRLWYRVLTYDVMYSERLHAYVDTLDVKLLDAQGQPLAILLRAGNPTSKYGELYDTGWHSANLDLKPYAGMSVQLNFTNCNGPQNGQPDNLLNTWSYVDAIEIYDSSGLHLPLLSQGNATKAAAETTAADVASPTGPEDAEPLR